MLPIKRYLRKVYKKKKIKFTKNRFNELIDNKDEIKEIKKHMKILQDKIDILSKKIMMKD